MTELSKPELKSFEEINNEVLVLQQNCFVKRTGQLLFAIDGIKKNSVNPHFRSKHWNMNDIHSNVLPECHKLDMFYHFYIKHDGNDQYLVLRLQDMRSQCFRESSCKLDSTNKDQDFGKQITYKMRYLIVPFFNIRESNLPIIDMSDDDGETNAGRPKNSSTAHMNAKHIQDIETSNAPF